MKYPRRWTSREPPFSSRNHRGFCASFVSKYRNIAPDRLLHPVQRSLSRWLYQSLCRKRLWIPAWKWTGTFTSFTAMPCCHRRCFLHSSLSQVTRSSSSRITRRSTAATSRVHSAAATKDPTSLLLICGDRTTSIWTRSIGQSCSGVYMRLAWTNGD